MLLSTVIDPTDPVAHPSATPTSWQKTHLAVTTEGLGHHQRARSQQYQQYQQHQKHQQQRRQQHQQQQHHHHQQQQHQLPATASLATTTRVSLAELPRPQCDRTWWKSRVSCTRPAKQKRDIRGQRQKHPLGPPNALARGRGKVQIVDCRDVLRSPDLRCPSLRFKRTLQPRPATCRRRQPGVVVSQELTGHSDDRTSRQGHHTHHTAPHHPHCTSSGDQPTRPFLGARPSHLRRFGLFPSHQTHVRHLLDSDGSRTLDHTDYRSSFRACVGTVR